MYNSLTLQDRDFTAPIPARSLRRGLSSGKGRKATAPPK
jgi:hypothetical protein